MFLGTWIDRFCFAVHNLVTKVSIPIFLLIRLTRKQLIKTSQLYKPVKTQQDRVVCSSETRPETAQPVGGDWRCGPTKSFPCRRGPESWSGARTPSPSKTSWLGRTTSAGLTSSTGPGIWRGAKPGRSSKPSREPTLPTIRNGPSRLSSFAGDSRSGRSLIFNYRGSIWNK